MRSDETTGTANLQKSVSPALEVITLNRESCQEYFIASVPEGNESSETLFQRATEAVREKKTQIISQEVFGISDKNGSGILPPVRAPKEDINGLANYRRPCILKGRPSHKRTSMDSFLTMAFCLPDFLFLNIIKSLYLSVVLGGYRSIGRSEFPTSYKWKSWGKSRKICAFPASEQKEVE
jgi:hypothetical protein